MTLEVRRERSANVGSFIPAQAKPAQILDDGIVKLRPAPVVIQIFDAKNQFPTALPSALLRAPERHRMPDMQIAGRGRGDAAAIGNFRFQIVDFRLA